MGGIGSGRKAAASAAQGQVLSPRQAANMQANCKLLEKYMKAVNPDDPKGETRLHALFESIFKSATTGHGPNCPPTYRAAVEIMKYLLGQPAQNVNLEVSREQDLVARRERVRQMLSTMAGRSQERTKWAVSDQGENQRTQ